MSAVEAATEAVPICLKHGCQKTASNTGGKTIWRCRPCKAESTKLWRERNPERAREVAANFEARRQNNGQPCRCGCGKLAREGSRYIRGHSAKRLQSSFSAVSQAEIDAAMQEPLTQRCAHCGYEENGTLLELRPIFEAHRAECPALKPLP